MSTTLLMSGRRLSVRSLPLILMLLFCSILLVCRKIVRLDSRFALAVTTNFDSERQMHAQVPRKVTLPCNSFKTVSLHGSPIILYDLRLSKVKTAQRGPETDCGYVGSILHIAQARPKCMGRPGPKFGTRIMPHSLGSRSLSTESCTWKDVQHVRVAPGASRSSVAFVRVVHQNYLHFGDTGTIQSREILNNVRADWAICSCACT